MAALTVPVCPAFPAGYVVQLADLQNLAACCTFMLQKPMTKIIDTSGGVSIPNASSQVAVTFSSAQFDVDGMWNSGNNSRLTVQTPGWYKIRYGIETAGGSGDFFNAYCQSTSGPDNPVGSGQSLNTCWPSSSGGNNYLVCGAAGIWPAYLWSGDYIEILIRSSTTGNTTGAVGYESSTAVGSYFSLEYVSTQ